MTNAWAFFWNPVTSWEEWKPEKTDKMFCTLLVVMKCISDPYHFVLLQARTVMYHYAHTCTQMIKLNYIFNSQLHLNAETLLFQISVSMFYRFTSTQDCNWPSPGKRLNWNSFRIFLFKAFHLTQPKCTHHYSFHFSTLVCINYYITTFTENLKAALVSAQWAGCSVHTVTSPSSPDRDCYQLALFLWERVFISSLLPQRQNLLYTTWTKL